MIRYDTLTYCPNCGREARTNDEPCESCGYDGSPDVTCAHCNGVLFASEAYRAANGDRLCRNCYQDRGCDTCDNYGEHCSPDSLEVGRHDCPAYHRRDDGEHIPSNSDSTLVEGQRRDFQ